MMLLQSLLVSKDDQTADTLTQVLRKLGVGVVRSSAAEAAGARLLEERFDQVVVDFEDPETASLILESCRKLARPDCTAPVTVAVVADEGQAREMRAGRAHFVLTKPVLPQQASDALRAATAMLKRERRQSSRVAVQAPVSLRLDSDSVIEGILLDLSAGGLDVLVLAAKPVSSSLLVHVSFRLPDSDITIEADSQVAWTAPSGQIGLHFLNISSECRAQLDEWLKAHFHEPDSAGDESEIECKLTDLSLGGCYVKTESPFPPSSGVDVCLKVGDMEVHAEGLVRVMHPGHGMGIEFPARTDEQHQGVEEFIGCLSSHPGSEPQLMVSPRSLVAGAIDAGSSAETDTEQDPLLMLLRNGGGMAQEQFLAELTRQRTGAEN